MLLLAALSRNRYDFHLRKELKEESGVGKSVGHAALQIIIAGTRRCITHRTGRAFTIEKQEQI